MDIQNGTALSSSLHIQHLTSAFYYRLDADFDYPGEAHSGWEFVYVEQGSIRVRANDAAYILKSGEMVCHQPMEFHHLRPYGGPASVIICCFDTDWQDMAYFKGKILPISPRQKQYLNDVIAYAGHLLLPKDPLKIAQEGAMDRNPSATASQEQSVKNALELLVLSLAESPATQRSKRVEAYTQLKHRRNITGQIKTYLQENLEKEITLEQLSRQFSYSPASIRRIFKAETGHTVMAYLTDLRMAKAKALLKENHLSIEAVATAVGYANLYYFSNAFKHKFGKSPSQYRKDL